MWYGTAWSRADEGLRLRGGRPHVTAAALPDDGSRVPRALTLLDERPGSLACGLGGAAGFVGLQVERVPRLTVVVRALAECLQHVLTLAMRRHRQTCPPVSSTTLSSPPAPGALAPCWRGAVQCSTIPRSRR